MPMIAMTSLQIFLFWLGWVLALPTLGFAVLWIFATIWCEWQRRAWLHDGWEEVYYEEEAPSVAEADALLCDPVSPDCSPMNAPRRQR